MAQAPNQDCGDRPVKELRHRDSIYTYMLYVPPVSRTRHGHYCTSTVIVGAMLLVVNVVLQVSLTIIAGSYIFEQHSQFLATLIGGTPAGGAGSEGSNYLPPLVHEMVRETLDPTTWLPKIWDKIGKLGVDVPKLAGCCVGADCAASGSPCCAPSGAPRIPALLAERREPKNNTPDRALCFFTEAGLLNCAPPTYGFLDKWQELDGNEDGVWTSEESEADSANLGCRLGIPVDEVLRHAAYGVRRDVNHGALVNRPDVGSGYLPEAPGPPTSNLTLTHAQFEWWRGLVALCASTDAVRCGELVRRGVFDGAMDPNVNTPRGSKNARRGGVVDLETAVEYCQWMLRPSGLCDVALPGTYMIYRSRVAEKCGKPAISAGDRHVNPHNPRDVMVVMDVTYKNVRSYQLIHGRPFKFFLTLILIMWFVSLVDELKDILDLADFVVNFPVHAGDAAAALPSVGQVAGAVGRASTSLGAWSRRLLSSDGVGADEEDGPRDAEAPRDSPGGGEAPAIVIESISRPHHLVCIVVAVVRLWVLMYMGNVGTGFVLSTHSFKDLLLNALALAFIFEMPEFLFKFLVSERTKQMMEGVSNLRFRSSLPTSRLGRLVVTKHFWGLFFIPLLSIAIVWNNDTHRTAPVLEALRCTCAQSGDRCLAAQQLGREWWDLHWQETVRLAEVLSPGEAPANSSTSNAPAPGEAPANASTSNAPAPAAFASRAVAPHGPAPPPAAAALLQVSASTVTHGLLELPTCQ